MRRDRLVVLAALALAAAVAPAGADDRGRGSRGIEDPARVGRPGEGTRGPRAPEDAAKGRELSGKVVKADSKTLYLEHMGAIVPLKIDAKTQFSGDGLSSSRDLAEGQEVRASFKVENETTNVAERISLASATGQAPPYTTGRDGNRPEQMPPGEHPRIPPGSGPGSPPDRQPVPRDPGSPAPAEPGGPAVPKY